MPRPPPSPPLPPFPGPTPPQPLASPADGVALWWCATDATDEALPTLASWLSAAEHARAARYAEAALARRYVAGRAALRYVLGGVLDTAPADVPIERGPRGRPRLAGHGIDFNVSNTRAVALVGVVALPGVRIGVDVEHLARELNHAGLARKFCTPGEARAMAGLDDDGRRRRFLKLWTCKEAMSKATGDALGAPLRRLGVDVAPALRLAEGPPPYVPADWRLLAAAVPDDYVATVALWRAEPAAAEGLTR